MRTLRVVAFLVAVGCSGGTTKPSDGGGDAALGGGSTAGGGTASGGGGQSGGGLEAPLPDEFMGVFHLEPAPPATSGVGQETFNLEFRTGGDVALLRLGCDYAEQRDLPWTLVDAGVLSVRSLVVTSDGGTLLARGSLYSGIAGAAQEWVRGGQCVIGCDAGALVVCTPPFTGPTDGGTISTDAGTMMDGG